MQLDRENMLLVQSNNQKPKLNILQDRSNLTIDTGSNIEKPLLIMNIDIAQGLQDQVVLFKNDFESIKIAASEFIVRNQLDHNQIFLPLIFHLQETLSQQLRNDSMSMQRDEFLAERQTVKSPKMSEKLNQPGIIEDLDIITDISFAEESFRKVANNRQMKQDQFQGIKSLQNTKFNDKENDLNDHILTPKTEEQSFNISSNLMYSTSNGNPIENIVALSINDVQSNDTFTTNQLFNQSNAFQQHQQTQKKLQATRAAKQQPTEQNRKSRQSILKSKTQIGQGSNITLKSKSNKRSQSRKGAHNLNEIQQINKIFEQESRNESRSERFKKILEDYSLEHGCENIKLQKFSFVPQIDKKSDEIASKMNGRTKSRSRLEQLNTQSNNSENKIMFISRNGSIQKSAFSPQNQTVHDRLHQIASLKKDKLMKQQKDQSQKYQKYIQAQNSDKNSKLKYQGLQYCQSQRSLNRDQTSQAFQRLYDLGQIKLIKQQESIKRREDEQIQLEKQTNTFHPEIDKKSLYMMSQRDFVPPEERLLNIGKQYEIQKHQRQQEYENQQYSELKLMPQINEAIRVIADNKRSKSRQNSLHQNKIQEDFQEEFDSIHVMRINHDILNNHHSRNGKQTVVCQTARNDKDSSNFIIFKSLYEDAQQREQSLKKRREEKIDQIRQQSHQRSRSATKFGQQIEEQISQARNKENREDFYSRLYQEKLGSPSFHDNQSLNQSEQVSLTRKREASQRTDKLYQLSKEQSLKRMSELSQKNKNIDNMQKEAKIISDSSSSLVNQLRDRKIREIFDKIDSNQDGKIKGNDINICQLRNKEVELLADLFMKIDERKLELNFEQFREMAVKKIQSINIQDRNDFFGPEKRESSFKRQEITFKVRINIQYYDLALIK
ncbi:UNKNOWN [Stylonychia lemnae]|uniref:EF-hand domain-containing protein n=1 Tax=Stylonychia lemnae TaxID=5949 RepID=A0A078AFL3_STYLE|nr:UNKNOWN [Stylonychia lemnae]|eukprot:CDW81029.1 UNKNOWN [Stylonychia lemnae]